MSELTSNECALILCILGVPDPQKKSRRIYPTVEESLSYMSGNIDRIIPRNPKDHVVVQTAVQLSLFG